MCFRQLDVASKFPCNLTLTTLKICNWAANYTIHKYVPITNYIIFGELKKIIRLNRLDSPLWARLSFFSSMIYYMNSFVHVYLPT
jgi:hypothetical protein